MQMRKRLILTAAIAFALVASVVRTKCEREKAPEYKPAQVVSIVDPSYQFRVVTGAVGPWLPPLTLFPFMHNQPPPSVAIQVSRNVRVSDKAAPFVEPYVAAHPNDPQSLIISATEIVSNDGLIARVFLTSGGGHSWSTSSLPQMKLVVSGGDVRTAIDNWVTYAPEGIAYFSSQARIRLENQWKLAILVYRSPEKGASWLGPTVITGASFDHPVISATGKGMVYIASLASRVDALGIKGPEDAEGILILRSTDAGASYKATGFIVPDDLGHQAENPVLLPNGTLIIPYGDYPLKPSHRLSSSRMYVVSSTDGGQTFGLPRLVGDRPRAWGGFFRIAVDTGSREFSGRLYAAWNGGDIGPDHRRGVRRDVSVAYSSDGGQTWSLPKVLYAADAGPAYFNALAVSPNGTVGVGWVQHERDGDKADCYRVYFAASADGGKTFSPPKLVSDLLSCPNSPEHSIPLSSLGGRTIFQRWARGGDYIGIAATSDNRFHLVWIDGRDGPFQVYSAAIAVGMNGQAP